MTASLWSEGASGSNPNRRQGAISAPLVKVASTITGLLPGTLILRREWFEQGEILVAESKNYVTGDAAFAVDRHGTIVFWNSAAEKTFGYPASTALGQKCWKLLSGHDSYDNSYCHEHCTLKEIAFRRQPVNGFQAALETASAGRQPFTISCLTILHDPGNELLLHSCRPEKETSEDIREALRVSCDLSGACADASARATLGEQLITLPDYDEQQGLLNAQILLNQKKGKGYEK